MSHDDENKPVDRPFGLPGGYFQQSARSVLNKVEWLEEHNAFPVLAKLQAQSGFTVPTGYFIQNEQQLELLDYPGLTAVKKQNAFTLPAGYFEELELLSAHMPVLAALPKQQPFTVPGTYFAENTRQLESLLLKPAQPARVIRLFSARSWMAVAALLVLALGIWLYSSSVVPVTEAANTNKDCGTIACLDKTELLQSKSLENLETDELYDLVNTKKLEQELQEKPPGAGPHKRSDSLGDEAADELLDGI